MTEEKNQNRDGKPSASSPGAGTEMKAGQQSGQQSGHQAGQPAGQQSGPKKPGDQKEAGAETKR